MHNLRDFRPELRSAIGQLSDAGYYGEAFVLTAALEGAYPSASEMLDGIGSAMRRVEGRLGTRLPQHVGLAFDSAKTEIRKVLPVPR